MVNSKVVLPTVKLGPPNPAKLDGRQYRSAEHTRLLFTSGQVTACFQFNGDERFPPSRSHLSAGGSSRATTHLFDPRAGNHSWCPAQPLLGSLTRRPDCLSAEGPAPESARSPTGWHSDSVIDLIRRVVAVGPETRVGRPYQLLKSGAAFRIKMGIPVEEGRDLGEGARAAELLDALSPHEVVRRDA